MQLHELGVAEAARMIRAGEISPIELVDSLLARIEIIDPDVRAWVTVDADRARADAATSTGPLGGVPIGLKDVIETAGLATTASSKVLADYVPERDATVVTALRTAGMVVLGKVHTAEFAAADPPPTRNPWHLDHTPGGSSSGSGAAVAAGLVPAALGTQTGGSTLRPAAYNGIVGLKPTYGLISTTGVLPLSWSFDHVGILTRSVEDAALVLEATAGYDPTDPASVAGKSDAFTRPDFDEGRAPVIGLIRPFYLETCELGVLEHTEKVAAELAAAGADVREIGLPASFDQVMEIYHVISRAEVAAYHQEQFAQRGNLYGPKLAQMIKGALPDLATGYARALRARPLLAAQLVAALADVDVAMTPTTPAPAPRNRTITGDPAYLMHWSFAGMPSISIPSGLSPWGLPLGIQLIARPWCDDRLLQAARWCEAVINFRSHPPCW